MSIRATPVAFANFGVAWAARQVHWPFPPRWKARFSATGWWNGTI